MSKKSQNSMEFVVLTSFMMLVFVVFFVIIQQRMTSATEEKNDAIAEQLLSIAVNEIKLAESVSDNYYREFTLPNNLNGLQYTISIIPGAGQSTEILITYGTKEKIYFLEQYISKNSSIGSGLNNISKNSGVVTIIHMTPLEILPDTTPPIIHISNPINNSTVSGYLDIIADASDSESGIAGVMIFVDGVHFYGFMRSVQKFRPNAGKRLLLSTWGIML